MEVYERLDDLVDLIDGARGLPLSDACVVNRAIALELVEAVRALMPASLRDAAEILADRDDVLEDAAREAESRVATAQDSADALLAQAQDDAVSMRSAAQAEAEGIVAQGRDEAAVIVDRARAEAERLVAADTVRLEAERQGQGLIQQAQADSARVRAEADIYVDQRLGQFEESLRSALDQVARGRRRASAAAPQAAVADVRDEVYDFTQDFATDGDLGGRRSRGNR